MIGCSGASIGNCIWRICIWRIKWSRDQWRYVTLKGQSSDLNTLALRFLPFHRVTFTISAFLTQCKFNWRVTQSSQSIGLRMLRLRRNSVWMFDYCQELSRSRWVTAAEAKRRWWWWCGEVTWYPAVCVQSSCCAGWRLQTVVVFISMCRLPRSLTLECLHLLEHRRL